MMGKKQSHDTVKKIAIGSTIAAGVGYVAGILTAPKSGKATRQDIKETTDAGLNEAEKDLKHLHTELAKVIAEAKARGEKTGAKTQKELQKLLETAQVSKQKAREVLSAIHEGDAQDKDLKNAVRQADASLQHLKTYLKK